jgi:hypothetical protein
MLKAENIRYLVVHCADTPDDQNLGARDIHQMHLAFGWHGVGYHRVICRDGRIEHGRPDYWVGAHVKGFNEISLGVCLIGRNDFTDALWRPCFVSGAKPIRLLKSAAIVILNIRQRPVQILMSHNGAKGLGCKSDVGDAHYYTIGTAAIRPKGRCPP